MNVDTVNGNPTVDVDARGLEEGTNDPGVPVEGCPFNQIFRNSIVCTKLGTVNSGYCVLALGEIVGGVVSTKVKMVDPVTGSVVDPVEEM